MAVPILAIVAGVGLLALAAGGGKKKKDGFEGVVDQFQDPSLPPNVWATQKKLIMGAGNPAQAQALAGLFFQAGSMKPAQGALVRGFMAMSTPERPIPLQEALRQSAGKLVEFSRAFLDPAIADGDTPLAQEARQALANLGDPKALTDLGAKLARAGFYRSAKLVLAKGQLVNFAASMGNKPVPDTIFTTAASQAQAVLERLQQTGQGPKPGSREEALAKLVQGVAKRLDPKLPPEVRKVVLDLLLKSKDVAKLRQAYRETVGQGYGRTATVLLEKALILEGTPPVEARQKAELAVSRILGMKPPKPKQAGSVQPVSPTNPGTAAPTDKPPTGPRPLPANLDKLKTEAAASRDRARISHVAQVLKTKGFPAHAEELLKLLKTIPAKPPAPPVVNAITKVEPKMPPAMAVELAKELETEKNPDKLEARATKLRAAGYKNAGALFEAAAVKIRAAHAVASGAQTAAAIVKPPAPAPAPAPKPAPRPPPLPGTAAELAVRMVKNLLTHPRKGSEDENLVRSFQTRSGANITRDGKYGVQTALVAGKYVMNIPPPRYFSSSKGTPQSQAQKYRGFLERYAAAKQAEGQLGEAAMFRMSAARPVGGLPQAAAVGTPTPRGTLRLPPGTYLTSIQEPPEHPLLRPVAPPAPPPPETILTSTTSPGQPRPTPSPAPAPMPKPKPTPETSPLLKAAEEMARHLLTKPKKGTEDRILVEAFQREAKLGTDGKYGPGTAKRLGAVVSNVPIVMYWPRGSTSKAVLAYRQALEALARKAESAGNYTRAALLRMSAARERGQGGIAGYVAPTKPRPTSTPDGPLVYQADAMMDDLGAVRATA